MKRITWAIKNGSGNIVRTEILDEGTQPKLKEAINDPTVGILPGETAEIIDSSEIPSNASMLEELRSTVLERAEAERGRILAQPGVGAAMLQRTETYSSKLTGSSTDLVKVARAALAKVDAESNAVIAQIDAAKNSDGINLPDWAQG